MKNESKSAIPLPFLYVFTDTVSLIHIDLFSITKQCIVDANFKSKSFIHDYVVFSAANIVSYMFSKLNVLISLSVSPLQPFFLVILFL